MRCAILSLCLSLFLSPISPSLSPSLPHLPPSVSLFFPMGELTSWRNPPVLLFRPPKLFWLWSDPSHCPSPSMLHGGTTSHCAGCEGHDLSPSPSHQCPLVLASWQGHSFLCKDSSVFGGWLDFFDHCFFRAASLKCCWYKKSNFLKFSFFEERGLRWAGFLSHLPIPHHVLDGQGQTHLFPPAKCV